MVAARSSPSAGVRWLLLVVVLILQFALLEAGLRVYGSFEGTTTFQSLFMSDPNVGVRLRPGANIRYTTVEFTADIAVNAQGVRDDEPLGPKPANERRVLVLGDSLVLAVQVPLAETFCKELEQRLNARGGIDHWRVINGGVQGYGPVQEWFYFDKIGAAFQPDVVLIVAFVGNDAIDAADAAAGLQLGRPVEDQQPTLSQMRRLVRSSIVLQYVRMRWDQLQSRWSTGTPERPMASYLSDPPPVVAQGLTASRQAYGRIIERAKGIGAQTAIALMPARFQTDDPDYHRLHEIVRQAGGELVRNSASERFQAALAPLGVPMVDLQPTMAAQPDRIGLFFQRTVHLTPRGHEVVSAALFDFLEANGLTKAAGR
jgi:hypothetical protein